MASFTDSEKINFLLICCTELSAGSKIDFEAVAKKTGLVSKSAAQQRFDRMLKANKHEEAQNDYSNSVTNGKESANADVPTKKSTKRKQKAEPDAKKKTKKPKKDAEKAKHDEDEETVSDKNSA